MRERLERWQERIAQPIAASPPGTPSPLVAERAVEGKSTFDEVRAAMTAQQDRLREERARARKTSWRR